MALRFRETSRHVLDRAPQRRFDPTVAVERQRDIDVGAERPRNHFPRLLAPQQRLPRVEMLRLVEIAVGDIRVVLQAATGGSDLEKCAST